MSTYQIAAVGDGFRIMVTPPDDHNRPIGGFFNVADANAWLVNHLRLTNASGIGAAPGAGRRGSAGTVLSDATPLSERRISLDQSGKWRKLAEVPDEESEAALVVSHKRAIVKREQTR